MEVSDVFWILFFLLMIQPMLRQRWLDAARQRLIDQIQRSRGSRVILLIHRQETVTFFGLPILRFIDINDTEEVLRAIDVTDPQMPLDLILHTPGGLLLPSLQIARALNRHPAKVTVFVPHYALSGGTLIALAADEIVMGKHSVLGPVDPQVEGYPAASVLRVLKQKAISDINDQTLILADQAEKATQQIREAAVELLADKCAPARAEEIAALLTDGSWTQDYAIHAEAALKLGLCVRIELPETVAKLISLYPQPMRKQRAVEYKRDHD